jgi:LDH2 family malate/lactate/ureidoglycolate dehydrogenase
LNPLEEAVTDINVWQAANDNGAPAEIRTEADKEGALILDFRGLAPGLKIKSIHDQLQARCAKNGIAAAGFHNSSGIITLFPWAFGLARRDLIGLALFNGGVNCCVPFGGTRGLFGTLPAAYAVPSADEPLASDMAMTEIPFFQIKNAKQRGEPLPERSAVDRHGFPTTAAAEALGDDGIANLLPVGGGFKGYSLVVLAEILTGSLVRSLLSNRQTKGWHPSEYGALVLAIDVASFTDVGRFKREVSEMCSAIRSQQPADWIAEVPIPGDRGNRKADARRKIGEIELSDALAEELAGLGRQPSA